MARAIIRDYLTILYRPTDTHTPKAFLLVKGVGRKSSHEYD